MLRDIPRVYLLVIFLAVGLVLLLQSSLGAYSRDQSMLVLNEVVGTHVIAHADRSARVYEGAYLLDGAFEAAVVDELLQALPAGSHVRFDYRFDAAHPDFSGVPSYDSSPVYAVVGEVVGSAHYADRPVTAVRVFARLPGESLAEWTYRTTYVLDSAP